MKIDLHITLSTLLTILSPIITFLFVIPFLNVQTTLEAISIVLGSILLPFLGIHFLFVYIIKANCPECLEKMKRTGIDQVRYSCTKCDSIIQLPETGKTGKLEK